MYQWIKKLVPLAFCVLFLSGYTVGNGVQAGGEIPWPLSNQRVVTVKNSQGLWELGIGKKRQLFNLEMKHDSRSGYDWVRVAKINQKTFKVTSWGEAFFRRGPVKVQNGYSSFFSVGLNPAGPDKHGRYLNMYPNGDLDSQPYVLRMVEVQTSIGRVLGLSVINYVEQNTDHYLGTRLLEEPLYCGETYYGSDSLECYIF